MSYRNLEIYKLAFELGNQLKRSSDSVITNIIEGYGRSSYRNDYIRFLIYSHASNDEIINHLEKIIILYPNFASEFETLRNSYNTLGGKLNIYKKWVIENWNKNNLQ